MQLGTQVDFTSDGTPTLVGGSGSTGGAHLFSIVMFPLGKAPFGFIDVTANNGPLSGTSFSDAYNSLVALKTAGETNIVTMSEWNVEYAANGGVCGKFALDTTTKTFRIPCAPSCYWRGMGPGLSVGTWQQDQFQGHYHATVASTWSGPSGGANLGYVAEYMVPPTNSNKILYETDSLNGVPRVGAETRPKTVVTGMYMKLYDSMPDATVASIAAKLDTSVYTADEPLRIKAWAKVSYTGPIIASFNITSVTKIGAGNYEIKSPVLLPDSRVLLTAHYGTGIGIGWMAYTSGAINNNTLYVTTSNGNTQTDTSFSLAIL